ncbi:MAG TPA: hypothetical protein VGF99_16635, partial [Myxococcota bacterium]
MVVVVVGRQRQQSDDVVVAPPRRRFGWRRRRWWVRWGFTPSRSIMVRSFLLAAALSSFAFLVACPPASDD